MTTTTPSTGQGPDPETVRSEVRTWLAEHWEPGSSLIAWRERLVDAGWAVPSWPPERFGRGLPAWADRIASEELDAAGMVGLPLGGGTALAVPTLLEHADEPLIERVLRPTLTGELHWCQLFSEPGAGSDLAGLATKAVRDGDEWIVNGQKVWTTSAHEADLAMLVARTDPSEPRHAGITYFVVPMRQPGVEVRPIRQMNRHSSFTEVFITDARVPDANRVGSIGDGWRVARATLAHERSFATLRRRRIGTAATADHRPVVEAQAEADAHFATYAWYPQRAGRADLLAERAGALAVGADALVRQEIASVLSFARANEWTARRAQAARALGRPPGPEGSIGKLAASEVARRANHAHAHVAGARGLLTGGDDPVDAVVAEVFVSTPAQSIAGGTDEIQRNIVGERILGLPREPSPR